MKDLESAKRVFFRRMFLIAYDTSAIVLSSFLSLLLRFEFVFNDIEEKYIYIFQKYTWLQILITITLFYIFRLYHSLCYIFQFYIGFSIFRDCSLFYTKGRGYQASF